MTVTEGTSCQTSSVPELRARVARDEPPGVVCAEDPGDAVCDMLDGMWTHLSTAAHVRFEVEFGTTLSDGTRIELTGHGAFAPPEGVATADLDLVVDDARSSFTLVLTPGGRALLRLGTPEAPTWIATAHETGVTDVLDPEIAAAMPLADAPLALEYLGERACGEQVCEAMRLHLGSADGWIAVAELDLVSGRRIPVAVSTLPGLGAGLEATLTIEFTDDPALVPLPGGEAILATDAGEVIAAEPALRALLERLATQAYGFERVGRP